MNAQLIDARTDTHLWADTFDGDASDIFALQASLAQKIAAALKATLTPGERTLIERRPTQNQAAYELFTRAQLLTQALSTISPRSEYEPIVALYEQAVAKDPRFALAFAHLSALHGLMYWFPAVDATAERRSKAEAALAAARRLAPDAPETHYAQGEFAYQCNDDWQGALVEYAVAESGMPNDAELQVEIGNAHRRLLNLTEAVRRYERAVALNPHDLNAVIALAETPLLMRRYAQAKTLAAQHLAVFPGDRRLRSVLISAQYELDGDYPAFNRARAEMGAGPVDPFGLGLALRTALLARDLSAAEHILADSRLDPNVSQDATDLLFPGLGTFYGAIGGLDSKARHRALVAFLLGKREAAAQFANELIASYRQASQTPRQKPGALLVIAEAEAFAGRADEAIRDGKAALALFHADDEYAALNAEKRFATIQLILDRRDDALASLQRLMSQPGALPQALRTDPIWSRLKDDPRFEEILKSAKVF
jgi:serine/threonine-protein kinase